jgi:flagellar basal-body rod modification protein FlgD
MINSTLASNTVSMQTSSTVPKKSATEESQDRFLKLLVTQMRNQDPLNPLDNAEVTSQMAQLSTVSGIDKLNATLQALSSSMIASQSMQAAAMIGHVVMVPGNGIELANAKGMAAVELTQPADSVSVAITDTAGNVVRNMQLGSQSSGALPFQWDGLNDAGQPVADGSYKFTATSQLGGVKSSAGTLSYGVVNSVMQGAQGATLIVGDIGEVSLASVKQIL